MLKHIAKVVGCLLINLSTAVAGQRQTIVLSAIDSPTYARLYEETLEILNSHSDTYTFEFKYMPNSRQLLSVTNGIVDGYGIKTDQTAEQMPGLLKIPTPLFYASSLVSVHTESEDIKDPKALLNLKVAIINGSGHSTNIIPKESRYLVNSHLSGLKMLASKRVDAMSILDIAYYMTLQDSPELALKTKLATFRKKVPFYMYIHERKKSEIPQLEEIIKKATAHDEIQIAYDRLIKDMKGKLSHSRAVSP